MPASDPVMTVVDKLPLSRPHDAAPEAVPPARVGPSPFGLRFAVIPVIPDDKHKKTYYTVTVKEATQVSQDGKVVTVQDDVPRERED
ncbi:MAG: hypothetical protein GEV28_34615 [Actinophytocola sp.]|uniref:hypothetical protein n=1 Tax=Actinophytocola sp. TaxID=1872138 RepID=UPI00132A86DD|nr:hypothetical protein [Actinophytocola sp.]MPZ85248.1 hypothetical protein [Actinophytocola sp.]